MLGLPALWQWLTTRPSTDVELPRGPGNEVAEHPIDIEDAPSDHIGLDTVSAWCGASSMASLQQAKKDVAFAKSIGLGRLDVIVNDHAKWSDPTPFDTYSVSKIEMLADEVRTAGLELHFMSWIMPHAAYIGRAAEILVPLVERTDARSIVLDAEEPYTLAKNALPYDVAAARIAEAFASVPFGVTGIGYGSKEKLGPLCSRAALLYPQCYSTSTSKMNPGTVVPKLATRWRAVFPGKPLAIGLAAYRQTGIPGYTAESAIRTAFAGAEADPSARVAVYWSLGQIKASSIVTKTLRSLLQR